jgi:hypothetical protein
MSKNVFMSSQMTRFDLSGAERSKFHNSLAMTRRISAHAMFWPMQECGPTVNGCQACRLSW